MKVSELLNILRSYDSELEFMISSDEDLWSIEQPSIREATLHETSSDFVVDDIEYDEERDGTITSTRNVLLIDLNL